MKGPTCRCTLQHFLSPFFGSERAKSYSCDFQVWPTPVTILAAVLNCVCVCVCRCWCVAKTIKDLVRTLANKPPNMCKVTAVKCQHCRLLFSTGTTKFKLCDSIQINECFFPFWIENGKTTFLSSFSLFQAQNTKNWAKPQTSLPKLSQVTFFSQALLQMQPREKIKKNVLNWIKTAQFQIYGATPKVFCFFPHKKKNVLMGGWSTFYHQLTFIDKETKEQRNGLNSKSNLHPLRGNFLLELTFFSTKMLCREEDSWKIKNNSKQKRQHLLLVKRKRTQQPEIKSK